MPLILERTVQDAAQKYLEKKYRKKAKGKRIFSKIESRTKQKYGSKRADGLLAFKHFFWGNYVVSMEAKSKKTLPAMKPYRDSFIFFVNSFKAGLYCCIGSGAFFALFKWNDHFWQFLLPFYVLVISALVYALCTWRSHRHQTMDVIDQLRQYPANEQWLAFSKDSYEALKKKKQKDLKKICKARGIGLMIYNLPTGQAGNRITVLNKPKFQWKMGKDFLKYYSKEQEIKAHLE